MIKQNRLGVEAKYGPDFYEYQAGASRESAEVVVELVNDLLHPSSVLDVGCGVGTWLAPWNEAGVTDLMGVDGDYVDRSALQIDPALFVARDLREPLSLGRRFDLVQSVEVAEHLDEGYAEQFVDSLAAHGDTILFSAAMPGQGGHGHVNEQWPSYWAEKFFERGFEVYDVIRPLVWKDKRVNCVYSQDILIYSLQPLDLPPAHRGFLDLGHPQFVHHWQTRPLSLRELLRQLPAASSAVLRRRLKG